MTWQWSTKITKQLKLNGNIKEQKLIKKKLQKLFNIVRRNKNGKIKIKKEKKRFIFFIKKKTKKGHLKNKDKLK